MGLGCSWFAAGVLEKIAFPLLLQIHYSLLFTVMPAPAKSFDTYAVSQENNVLLTVTDTRQVGSLCYKVNTQKIMKGVSGPDTDDSRSETVTQAHVVDNEMSEEL